MNGGFFEAAVLITIIALIVAGACALLRLLRGPSLMDRVVALDVLAVLVVGMIAVTAIQMDQPALIDAALALALVAFLGTVAFARFLEERNQRD